jgi:hypothetical protein
LIATGPEYESESVPHHDSAGSDGGRIERDENAIAADDVVALLFLPGWFVCSEISVWEREIRVCMTWLVCQQCITAFIT